MIRWQRRQRTRPEIDDDEADDWQPWKMREGSFFGEGVAMEEHEWRLVDGDL